MLAGSWELHVVLISAPWSSRKSATSKWLLMTDQASAASRTRCVALRAPLARIFLDSALRHVRTAGVVILDIAQRRRAGLVEPLLHPREVAHACRMRQIVRQRPDAGEQWNEVCPRVRERELDGLRWGRRLAPQDRGIEVEKGGDEFPAIVQRCPPDDAPPETPRRLHRAATAHAATGERTPSGRYPRLVTSPRST